MMADYTMRSEDTTDFTFTEEELLDAEDDDDDEDYYDSVDADDDLQMSLSRKADYRAYKCLSVEEAYNIMDDATKRTSITNKLSQSICKVLLCKYKWDCRKLDHDLGTQGLFKLLESHDLRSLAAVIGPISNNSPIVEEELEGTTIECSICFENTPSELIPKPECGHKICLSCWQHHFRQKIDKEGEGIMIICPMCPYIIQDSLIKEVVPELRLKLDNLQVNSFIQSNPLVTWCPGTSCSGRIISVESASWGPGPVSCNHCQEEFCFACRSEWHAPLRCDLVEIWKNKVKDSSQSMDWIKGNSKACPKCGVFIEKNGGCNHIHCTNAVCKYDFCWICMGPVHCYTYDNDRCPNMSADKLKPKLDEQGEARRSVEYFVFHSDRYYAHMNSLKLEEKLSATIDKVFDQVIKKCGSKVFTIDIYGMKDAIKILNRCRRMLAYGYAFAYFLLHSSTNSEAKIYEQNLTNLHGQTEKLSFLLEQKLLKAVDTGILEFEEARKDILDTANFCDGRRLKIISHVMENYDRGLWTLRT